MKEICYFGFYRAAASRMGSMLRTVVHALPIRAIEGANSRRTTKSAWRGVAMTLAFGAAAAHIMLVLGSRDRVTVSFLVTSSESGAVQLFQAADGRYSEEQSSVHRIDAEKETAIRIDVPQGSVRFLRIDPSTNIRLLRMCELSVATADRMLSVEVMASIDAVVQTEVAATSDRCVEIRAVVNAVDPQVHLRLDSINEVLPTRSTKARTLATLATGIVAVIAAILLLRDRGIRRRISAALAVRTLSRHLPILYLVLAMGTGTVLAFVTPPGAVPDEFAHAVKAILVSDGTLIGDGNGELRVSFENIVGPFGDPRHRKYSVSEVVQHATEPLGCSRYSGAYPTHAVNYSPMVYVLPALVLAVACETGGTVGTFFYGARLANLLASVVLVFIGLRFSGTGRWALFVMAMLPMTLHEIASMTADSITIGLSFCLLGLFSGVASGRMSPGIRIEWSLFALGIAIALSKPGCAWIMIGYLWCRLAYLRRGRRFWPAFGWVVVAPWAVHAAWTIFSWRTAVPRSGVDPGTNLNALQLDPGGLVAVIYHTFFGEHLSFLWKSMIGLLGWLDVPLEPSSYMLATLMIVGATLLATRSRALRLHERVVGVGAAGASILMFSVPLYLYWTLAGSVVVQGLQGRYFIISVAFALIALTWKAHRAVQAIVVVFILVGIPLVLLDAISEVVSRYYA